MKQMKHYLRKSGRIQRKDRGEAITLGVTTSREVFLWRRLEARLRAKTKSEGGRDWSVAERGKRNPHTLGCGFIHFSPKSLFNACHVEGTRDTVTGTRLPSKSLQSGEAADTKPVCCRTQKVRG